jgi:hypothetical protein
MKRKLPLAMVPLVVLLGVALLGGDHDPNTGELLEEPLESESVQMSAEKMAPYFNTSEAGLVEVDAPGGGKMIDLRGRFQQAFTARIDETGTVVYNCDRADHAAESESQVEKEGR